jgi:dTMP kinase
LLITLDGIDGVGKSTIAHLLEERLNATTIKGVRDIYVDKLAFQSRHLNVRCLYYLASFLDAVLDAKKDNETIIFDKSFYSTIAYHRALGSEIDIERTLTSVVAPDLSIYLTCSRKVWVRRLEKREKIDWYEQQLLSQPLFAEKIEELYLEMGLLRIENNDLEETVAEILKLISSHSSHEH